MDDGFLALADWRRRVAEIYADWRSASATDPQVAWLRWREALPTNGAESFSFRRTGLVRLSAAIP